MRQPASQRSAANFAAVLLALSALAAGCAAVPAERRLSAAERSALDAWRRGDFAAAYTAFKMLSPDGRDPRWSRAAGACALHAGNLPDAVASFAASARRTRGAWERFRSARAYLDEGSPSRAISELGEPSDAWGHFTKAQALRRLGINEEALREFQAAVQLDPSFAIAEQEMGETLVALGRPAEAVREYEAAIAIDKSFTHLQLRVAELESRLGKVEAAFARYGRFLLVDPQNSAALEARKALAKANPSLLEAEKRDTETRQRAWQDLTVASAPPLPTVPRPDIAVGIVREALEFRVKCSTTLVISSAKGTLGTVPPGTEVRGGFPGSQFVVTWGKASLKSSGPVRLTPAGEGACFAVFGVHFAPGYFWSEVENRTYRGTLEARPRRERVSLVNRVQIEEYLLSLLPAEMPASWPAEALKAQAVAARSETFSKLGRHGPDGFDVCPEQHCAVYRGTGSEQATTTQAVLATRGEILEAGGKPVGAVYSDNCGGWGAPAREVWGSDIPGLGAVCDVEDCPGGEWSDVPVNPDERDRFLFARPRAWCNRPGCNFRWARSYRVPELEAIIGRKFRVGKLRRIYPSSFTSEGRVLSLEIEGDAGSETSRKDGIRSTLGALRSNFFTVETMKEAGGLPPQVLFIGAGWGHGVGFCQSGARGLALAGKNYHSILSHYCPGAKLQKVY